ncbi:enoyl-CoA hydratase [Hoeflea halophila]|uniref:Enoyl-CoA hydratase n=1 Tax=Hoeflea halophila TaxID=714899 RepID=A0A286IEP6_9HYPH|nr:crotonase/enoyl-CoA hydratase family protein [Hoeflea halophila]SOE18126.1 enoyl-CoA hydratase [Hoeflea halophila]
MHYACFTVEIADYIAHIRFNRPEKANSMTPKFWAELPQAVDKISNDAEARVIVISSEGKHFTAGMDISVFMSGGLDGDAANPQVSAEAFRYKIKALQETFSALERARQPVLAAIQGGAIGAGVDLATACDCRYASADAFFAVQETAIGMTADVGTFPRLVKLIPEGWARQMAYTGERLPAEKAMQIGLVNEVFETHDELLDGVMAIAHRIAAHSPLAVTGSKAMANYSRDHTTADTLDYISVWNAAMLRPDDIREAYTAKGEKRAPEFDDLKPVSK